ncbi:HK97 gp10 family phage protein [Tibeticola sediminis]|uniref:HK97 gp10 family phage protein n=1 Tax=Tibeticola sediminis TaxID=1917811 RepID=UPI000F527313|nr:HK97 gp10 family phage protein [Tibeticola sediminis]
MTLPDRRLMQMLAEHLREIAQRQGNIPWRTGNLYKSIIARVISDSEATVGTNVLYARAVHDGRPPMVIKPARKKALYWKGAAHPVKAVKHPGIKPNPYLARAAERFTREPLPPDIRAYVGEEMARALEAHFKSLGLEVRRR